jgi:hypothetical protein
VASHGRGRVAVGHGAPIVVGGDREQSDASNRLVLGRAEPAATLALPVWALVVTVVILMVREDLEFLGKNEIRRATPPVPENTDGDIERDVATVQERIKR